MTILFQSQLYHLKVTFSSRLHKLVMRQWTNLCVGFSREAVSCDFGVLQDDYIHHQVIDQCYLRHLGLKFLGQETVTLDCLLGAGSH